MLGLLAVISPSRPNIILSKLLATHVGLLTRFILETIVLDLGSGGRHG